MKANKQSKIKVKQSGYKRSRFNWNHDVNTTFSWGEIQPVGCKMIQPNSKTTVKTQNLIRLAPMVAPTFGRVKYKTFNQFVDVADIFPNYDAMMAQQPVNRNGRTKVPQKLPCIKLGQLSSWVYQGAKATIYWVPEDQYGTNELREAQADKGEYVTWFKSNASQNTIPQNVQTMLNYVFGTESNKVFQPVGNSNIFSSIPGAPKLYPDWLKNSSGFYLSFQPKLADSAGLNSAFTGSANYGNLDYQIILSNNDAAINPVGHTLLPYNPSVLADAIKNNPSAAYVSLESADALIEFRVNSSNNGNPVYHYYCLAVEFSDYGKRLRKILQGCGYQIDLGSNEDVSILPLLAQYKAYFDIFGLQLYQGWETTYCSKLIDYIKNNFIETIDFERFDGQATDAIRIASMPYTTSNANYRGDIFTSFCSFMFAEVAQEWYTEDPDWIGSHMSKLAVSPTGPDEFHNGGMITVDSNGIDLDTVHVTNRDGQYAGDGVDSGQIDANRDSAYVGYSSDSAVHAYITQLEHSQVDADLLKRLYKWTNRNSILGREIAKLLRAQGLGDYVDECKSNFIGTTDNMITISDVVSMADTSNENGGAVLGEYGGKGLQYMEHQTLVFENDSLGYWITLACIVPEAGYTQGLDPTLTALDKFSLYNPDFDALGMELTKKSAIVGCNYDVRSVNSVHGVASRLGFGFTPRYSKFKVAGNLVNGDFNRHNMRNTYLPYTLDKQLYVNDFDTQVERITVLPSNGDTIGTIDLKRSLVPETLPVAGNIWRTPTKYPWLGHFNRIFMNIGDRRSTDINDSGVYHGGDSAIGFTDFNADNFLSHGIVEMQCYAPMKPIEDSYGLDDDEVGTTGADFVTKA